MPLQVLERFSQLMQAAAAIYGQTLTEEKLDAYYNMLSHLAMEDLEYAIRQHALDPKYGHKFFVPADIIRMLEGRRTSQKSPQHAGMVKCTSLDFQGQPTGEAMFMYPCAYSSCKGLGTIAGAGDDAWYCAQHYFGH